MLQSHSFRVLRNPEFIQQGKDLTQIIADANTTNLGIKKQHDAFKDIFTEMDDVYKTSQKSPFTQLLISLDEKRDRIFMGICFIVDGYLKHWEEAVVAQANLIADSIDLYGRDVVLQNYQAQSASVTSLIDSWETNAPITAALTAFNLESWKNELKATNNLFIKTYTDRSQADGNAEALPKIKELREKAIIAWEKLVTIIQGKTEEFEDDTSKAPLYTNLINSINGVLDSYNTILLLRQGKKAAKKSDTPNTPTT